MIDTSKPPSLFRRLAVVVYDAFLLVATLFFATAVLLPFHQGESFEPNTLLYTLYLIVVSFLFYGWFWTKGGQTLGLMAWKLQVVNEQLQPISWRDALVRYGIAVISMGLCGLGFIWMLFDKEHRTWHDKFSQTNVVWKLPEK